MLVGWSDVGPTEQTATNTSPVCHDCATSENCVMRENARYDVTNMLHNEHNDVAIIAESCAAGSAQITLSSLWSAFLALS